MGEKIKEESDGKPIVEDGDYYNPYLYAASGPRKKIDYGRITGDSDDDVTMYDKAT